MLVLFALSLKSEPSRSLVGEAYSFPPQPVRLSSAVLPFPVTKSLCGVGVPLGPRAPQADPSSEQPAGHCPGDFCGLRVPPPSLYGLPSPLLPHLHTPAPVTGGPGMGARDQPSRPRLLLVSHQQFQHLASECFSQTSFPSVLSRRHIFLNLCFHSPSFYPSFLRVILKLLEENPSPFAV